MQKTGNAISIRLDENQREGVKKLAESYEVDAITIIRWSVSAMIAYAKAHKGRIVRPTDFAETFRIYRIGEPIDLEVPARTRSTKRRDRGAANAKV